MQTQEEKKKLKRLDALKVATNLTSDEMPLEKARLALGSFPRMAVMCVQIEGAGIQGRMCD